MQLNVFEADDFHLDTPYLRLPDGIPREDMIFFKDKGCHFAIHYISTIHYYVVQLVGSGII